MNENPSLDSAVARALERGVPIVREPFAEVARSLGVTEADVLTSARRMMGSGLIRRFGAFFDYHRLGYSGYLFGASVSGSGMDGVISRIRGNASVTHAYARRHELNFWFTALFRDECGAKGLCALLRESGCPFVALETVQVIKLRPSFAGGESKADISPRVTQENSFPSDADIKIVRAMSGGLAIAPRPFDPAAEAAGMDAGEFLSCAERMAQAGILRRIGASFNHYRAGWTSNSLCAADLSGVIHPCFVELAVRASRHPWVSHCYLRKLFDCDIPGVWPYNLYVMLHADSDPLIAEREEILRGELGCDGFISLRTVREYKKTSFKMEAGDSGC